MNDSVKKIQEMLDDGTAALVTNAPNRFYLTDFNNDAGCVFITRHFAVFFTDFRYIEAAAKISSIPVLESKRLFDEINEQIDKHRIKKILIETDFVTMQVFTRMQESLAAEVLASDILSKKLKELRSVKCKTELQLIEKAQELTDETFSYILPRIEVGRREKDIMLDMELFMRKMGSEGVSFDFIVVSGKNTSLPHGVPSEKRIEKGDFVTMDFGAVIGGYRSDMTRTVAVGFATDEQKAVYSTVLKAQTSAINEIKAGKRCCDIDKTARDIIERIYPNTFGHGLGHSVGIEIHESPAFNTRDDTVLQENTVMTVEPGIYLADRFGVRIEDMVIVKANGVKNITKSSKELLIL